MSRTTTANGLTALMAAAATAELIPDAKASGQLRILFANYISSKKRRPKAPSEAKALPALVYNPDALQPLLDEFIVKWHEWLDMMGNLMVSIQTIGKNNPGACFSLTSKGGRVVSVNGERLFSALCREDGDILGGKLTVSNVTGDTTAE